MELSKRLQFIAEHIDKCKCIIDVGTDHGDIPIYCIKNNLCNSAIASDINKDPVKKLGGYPSSFFVSYFFKKFLTALTIAPKNFLRFFILIFSFDIKTIRFVSLLWVHYPLDKYTKGHLYQNSCK